MSETKPNFWQRRQDLATWFADRGERKYAAPQRVENIPLSELQATPNASNELYSAIEGALFETGTRVGGTVGDLMNALGINQKQLHEAVCYCNNGDSVTAAHFSVSLRGIPADIKHI